ncbi:hypothetical protein [Anaerotruncus rubiinfantis]|uniref:hypothetical protein n=1 Tax=Anaerotruncus rubiinfantis TaxID=1720200 RepID=UPI000833A3C7|nr:hypothetical protein [Anaerotruncus rubiinfantis]
MESVKLVDNPVAVTEKKREIGDPGPGLTFIFSMLAICFWGSSQGLYSGQSVLAMGIVQLACYIPYLISTVLYYLKGDTLNAAIFMIFSTLFGGVGGGLNIAAGIGQLKGFELSPEISAIPYFCSAVAVVPLLICVRKKASATTFLCFSAVVIFLTLPMLVTYGVLPAEGTNTVIKYLYLFVAVGGFYTMFNALLVAGGCKPLPEGKPLFK